MPQFTDLDFDRFSPVHFFMDKKAGVKITMGHIGRIELRESDIAGRYAGLMLAIETAGMDQDRLDRISRDLERDCARERFDILLTRSKFPFDKKWYLMGDLKSVLNAAGVEKLKLPFSAVTANAILRIVEQNEASA